MLWGGKANLCGIELARARCDRFLVIRLFWLPPSLPVPCSILLRKRWGGKMGRGRQGEKRRGRRRKCVWIWGVRSVTVYNPLRCRLCRKGNHFSCWETFPHVNLTPPPPHVYFQSLICSLRPLSLLFHIHNATFSFILLFHFWPVMVEYHLLTLSDRLTETEPHCSYFSLKLSLLAIILCARGCVVLCMRICLRYKS